MYEWKFQGVRAMDDNILPDDSNLREEKQIKKQVSAISLQEQLPCGVNNVG